MLISRTYIILRAPHDLIDRANCSLPPPIVGQKRYPLFHRKSVNASRLGLCLVKVSHAPRPFGLPNLSDFSSYPLAMTIIHFPLKPRSTTPNPAHSPMYHGSKRLRIAGRSAISIRSILRTPRMCRFEVDGPCQNSVTIYSRFSPFLGLTG